MSMRTELDKVAFRKLAENIAYGLGFKINPQYGNGDIFRLDGPDRQVIAVTTEWNDHSKVIIRGEYPGGHNHLSYSDRDNLPRIGVSMARGAAVIVKEIQRRFLPDYLAVLGRAVENEKRHNESEAAKKTNLQALASILGEEPSKHQSDTIYLRGAAVGKVYGDVQVYENDANIKLSSVPMGLAKEICELIVSWYKK